MATSNRKPRNKSRLLARGVERESLRDDLTCTPLDSWRALPAAHGLNEVRSTCDVPRMLVLCYSLELGSTIRLVNARHGESGAPP